MAGATLSTLSGALKSRYLGPLQESLNSSTVLLDRIEKKIVQTSGGTTYLFHHASRNVAASIGRADTGTLPTAGYQGVDKSEVDLKYTYSVAQITGPSIAATRDNAGSIVQAVEFELDRLQMDTKKAVNRQFHGDSRDALAFWTSADNTTAADVDDNQGIGFVHLPVSGTLTCDLIDVSDNTTKLGDSIVVTLGAINSGKTAYSVGWSGTVAGSADGDYLIVEDSRGYQMQGLDGIINTGDNQWPHGGGTLEGVQGLAVASYPYWKSQVFNGSTSGTAEAISFARMQEPISAICANSDAEESDIEFLLSNYGVRDKYVELCLQSKWQVNTKTLDGGWTGVAFNDKPIIVDGQCKRQTLYYIVPKALVLVRSSDFEFMSRHGSRFIPVADADAYRMVLFHYGNLATWNRNQLGRLNDITDQ